MAITVALGLVLAVGLLKSSWGEERARGIVEDAITSPEGTRLRIERLGDFELFSPPGTLRATAQNLRLVDATGQDLVEIGELTADLDLSALWRFELRFDRAKVAGAQIACDANTGRPLLASRPERREVFQPRSLDVVLNNVEVVGLYGVAPRPDGSKGIIARLAGDLDLFIEGAQPGLKMKLRRLHGVIAQPQSVRLHDASGTVDTAAAIAADIKFRADARGAALSGRLLWRPDDRFNPLVVDVQNASALGPGSFGDMLQTLGGAIPRELLSPAGLGIPLGL